MRIELDFAQAGGFADGDLRDLHLTLPPSFFANGAALPQCSAAAFHTPRLSPYQQSLSGESCPDASQIGIVALHTGLGGGETRWFGLYNLTPPYGSSEAIGFAPFGRQIVLRAAIREPDAAFVFGFDDLPQSFDISGLDFRVWGIPGGQPSPKKEVGPYTFEQVFEHDNLRGNCLNEEDPEAPFGQPGRIITVTGPGEPSSTYIAGTCSSANPLLEPPRAYLSLPSTCGGPLLWTVQARSWQQPALLSAEAESHDDQGRPLSLSNCIEPLTRARVQLRTENAASPTGLVFNLDLNDGGGLLNNGGIVRSQIDRAVVRLPEGLTINPSLGAGLGVCSEADFAREAIDTPPGSGCPNNSKIGTTEVEGLLGLSEPITGSVYLAQPYQNPRQALIALYITIDSPRWGVFEKAAGELAADEGSGRLTATFEGLPKLHYTHFALSLREGQRAALVSPPLCGSYRSDISMTPWSDPALSVPDFSDLPISHGETGGSCPDGSLRPFHPGLQAGSLNPQAGAYTPYYLHMTRTDTEQEITSYSATLPPGLLGAVAGVPYCPQAAIDAARANSGAAELEHPSCPPASRIGHTLAGYGVGGVLAYAPGALYLAGPYHGAPLSTLAIDSALVGPFDLGTVIVRSAIDIDPRSARVSIDSAGSDPIPHMMKGIPLHLRDIRVYIDRPDFTLNPTSCDPLTSLSTLTGAGLQISDPADDMPATSADRYQVFNCSGLGFEPRLSLRLRGSTDRAGYPSLRASYRPRPRESNIASATVALPHSEFLAQSHINELCTPHQFALAQCPPSSVYGHVSVGTPLLSEPISGDVFLRSSPVHPLPDLVIALRQGSLAIDLVARISSSRGGGMRASFTDLPDAPVRSFTMTLRRGAGSLLENSADLCTTHSFAGARLIAHDNASRQLRVPLRSSCPGKSHHHRHPRREH
jgi:hypothetical protein